MSEDTPGKPRGLVRRLKIGLAIAAFFVVVGVVRWLVVRPPAVAQPVAFDHRMHTEQLKMQCQLCHQYLSTGAHAGLPSRSLCAMCHQVPQGTTAMAARLTMMLGRGDSLRFNKLFHLPPYVYFTHRRHVAIAKIPCQTCHGAIASTQRPPKRPLVQIRMQVCLDCHLQKGQSVDCVACHR
jgi:predicted CXXCH cytochrome family protein